MESQPRASGGTEGKSSDEIVFELSEMVIASILEVIKFDDAHQALFKVIHLLSITQTQFNQT